jgi:hypothetical protein
MATTKAKGLTAVQAEDLAVKATMLDATLTGLFELQERGTLTPRYKAQARIGMDGLLHEIRTGLANAAN